MRDHEARDGTDEDIGEMVRYDREASPPDNNRRYQTEPVPAAVGKTDDAEISERGRSMPGGERMEVVVSEDELVAVPKSVPALLDFSVRSRAPRKHTDQVHAAAGDRRCQKHAEQQLGKSLGPGNPRDR